MWITLQRNSRSFLVALPRQYALQMVFSSPQTKPTETNRNKHSCKQAGKKACKQANKPAIKQHQETMLLINLIERRRQGAQFIRAWPDGNTIRAFAQHDIKQFSGKNNKNKMNDTRKGLLHDTPS